MNKNEQSTDPTNPSFTIPNHHQIDFLSLCLTTNSISGLSPFMGETDIETMANVTIAKYDFEDESFASVSPEGIDFISKLLVKDLR